MMNFIYQLVRNKTDPELFDKDFMKTLRCCEILKQKKTKKEVRIHRFFISYSSEFFSIFFLFRRFSSIVWHSQIENCKLKISGRIQVLLKGNEVVNVWPIQQNEPKAKFDATLILCLLKLRNKTLKSNQALSKIFYKD